MEYDVSGKVKRVLDGADQEITAFAYDDRGFRILKRTGAREEWYVRDASGNIMSIYHRDTTANSLAQIELPIYGSGKIGNAFRQPDHLNYNYELTDHLGNVRATFSNVHTLAVASMEPDNNAWEEQYFDNLSTRHSDPLLAQESYYSARLRPTTPVGPTITLEVKQGATIHLSVGGRYVIPQGGFNPANLTGGIGNLLNGSFDAGVVGEAGMPAPANIIGDALALLGAVSLEDEAAPKAYLQYILFDENWAVIASDEVGIPSGASTQYMQMELPDIPVANDGYLYAYVVNESEIDVHFDNLTVSVLGLNVLSTRNYYPYGSVAYEWKNPDFDDRYRFGYQGQFAEEDTVTGWNHFEAREYDAKIGRWLVPDPARQFDNPYIAFGNNPIFHSDPDGRFVTDPKIVAYIMTAYSKALTKYVVERSREKFSMLTGGSYEAGNLSVSVNVKYDTRWWATFMGVNDKDGTVNFNANGKSFVAEVFLKVAENPEYNKVQKVDWVGLTAVMQAEGGEAGNYLVFEGKNNRVVGWLNFETSNGYKDFASLVNGVVNGEVVRMIGEKYGKEKADEFRKYFEGLGEQVIPSDLVIKNIEPVENE